VEKEEFLLFTDLPVIPFGSLSKEGFILNELFLVRE
jgi:hypothetical protein